MNDKPLLLSLVSRGHDANRREVSEPSSIPSSSQRTLSPFIFIIDFGNVLEKPLPSILSIASPLGRSVGTSAPLMRKLSSLRDAKQFMLEKQRGFSKPLRLLHPRRQILISVQHDKSGTSPVRLLFTRER